MQIVGVNGTKIAFEEVGTGEPLLLIHGGMISHREWLPQIKQLSAHARLILPDVRGHGASGRDGMPYSVAGWASDLVKLMDALNIERFVVCGHSMGGTVAQQIAAEYPARVKGLIIAESNYGVTNEPLMRMVSGLTTWLFKRLGAKTAIGLASATLGASPGAKAMAQEEMSAHVSQPANLFAILDAMNAYDGRDNLKRITCPTLVISGADFKLGHKQSREMAQTIPGAQYVVIPNAGHGVNWDNPEAFNQAVLTFLRGLV